ncbi:RNA polymerase sigma-54 factor [Desulfovibrionales bacterium]
MVLELRQQLKLSQQLVMTPQLQQAIKLLQLSRLELIETIQNELLENPFLEEEVEERTNVDANASGPDQAANERPITEGIGEFSGLETGSERDLHHNADWEDYLGDFSSTSCQSHFYEGEDTLESMPFEMRLSGKQSLGGHLEWQLRLSNFTPKEILIGEVIIGNLDSAGYLQVTAEEVVRLAEVTPAEVEAVLYRIQRFDPLGVAARSPQECLLVQLEARSEKDPILLSLVRDHMEDLEKKRYKLLCRKFHIALEDLKHYLEILQKLDPLPGASFGSEEPFYVIPDVFVYRVGDDWIISLNNGGLPQLELNSFCMDILKLDTGKNSGKYKDYLHDKMRSAVWLMKSLYQRQRTLYKVSESLIKYQRGFFEHGVKYLRPLILKDIAVDIGMHESTVSRITTNKYMATPYGVFGLKFFFNSALELDGGGMVGSESVKALIKQIIGEENPRQPFSDAHIVKALKKKLQVNIARRTVAKYRTALDIASSSRRKKVL